MDHKPKRRWHQFSLQGLLIAVLIVASYFAGLVTMRNRAQEAEEEVVYWKRHAKEINDDRRRKWLDLMLWKEKHGIPQGADP
jgi:hypothetical protein